MQQGQDGAGRNQPGAARSKRTDFPCRSCGASLLVTGKSRIIICDYCGTQNTVPQDVWDQFAPRAPAPAASPYGGPTPAAGQPLPLPPRRSRSNKSLLIIFIIFFAIMGAGVVIPIMVGFCGACVAIFGGMAATTTSQNQPVTATEELPSGPLTINSQGSGISLSQFVSTDVVTPSFDRADASATAEGIFKAVRAKWNAEAVLGQAVFTKVRSDGTMDLGAGGGSMVLTFYVPPGGGAAAAGDNRLIVTAANSMVIEVPGNAGSSEIESTELLSGMPACTIKKAWKEALKEGYSESGEASIIFPHLPPILSAKERKKEEDYYAYLFTVSGGKTGKANYFLLKDCRAR